MRTKPLAAHRARLLAAAVASVAALALLVRPARAGLPRKGDVTPYVVGGHTAPVGRFPYQLGLQIGPWKCGASLIREDVALSAGHCGPKTSPTTKVTSGAYLAGWSPGAGDVHSPPFKAYVHPDFNKNTYQNDFSLIFMKDCVDVSPGAKAKVIPLATADELAAHLGNTFMFSGWGTTSPNSNSDGTHGDLPSKLQYGYGKYVDAGTCTNYEMSLVYDASMICAGDVDSSDGSNPPFQDTCQGDSGGPLVFNLDNANDPVQGSWASDRLIGVTSWGFGCGQGAGVYSRAPNYLDWINQQLDAIKKPCAAADITFVQVSADRNFATAPAKVARLSVERFKADKGLADCQALCAAAAPTGGCMAFSISMAARNVATCNIFANGVPSTVCGSSGKGLCAKQSAGSYRVVYKYT